MFLLLTVLAVGGFFGAAWYWFTPAPSPAQQKYEQIPEYFPPANPEKAKE